jgi:hypothetical protein
MLGLLLQPGIVSANGDSAWLAARTAQNLLTWPDPMPPLSDPTQLTISHDGQYYMLSNSQYAALLASPTNPNKRGSLVGLYDRNHGADFFHVTAAAMPEAWSICLGDQSFDGEAVQNCASWVYPFQVIPVCTLEDTNGNSLGACVSGAAAPVLTLTWAGVSGGLTVQQRWKLTSDGLFQQPRMTGTASKNGPVVFRGFIFCNLGQDPNQNTRVVIGQGYNTGTVFGSDLGGLTNFWSPNPLMSFFGFIRGQDAIYVGIEDPTGTPKLFAVDKPADTGSGAFSVVSLYPENPGTPQATAITPNWWAKLKPLHGDTDWAMLTNEYRTWAIANQNYVPLSQRGDLPQALKDGVFWQLPLIGNLKTPASGLLQQVTQAKSLITAAPMAYHLYHWYHPGFDTGNGGPNNAGFTPKTASDMTCGPQQNQSCGDWTAAVATIEGGGDFVVPYINPNYGDISDHPYVSATSPYGHWSLLSPYVCKNPAGSLSGSPYNVWSLSVASGALLAVMDPRTSFWQQKFNDMWTAVRTLHSRGVYLDTFGSWGFGCWPTGYSSSTLAANIGMLTGVHGTHAADNIFIAAEAWADYQHQVVDVGVDYGIQRPEAAPLYEAVYHDAHIVAGPATYKLDQGLSFELKVGRSAVWGNQIGLQSNADYGTGTRLAYENTLIGAHLALKRFLAYGLLVAPMLPGTSGATDMLTVTNWCVDPACQQKMTTTQSYVQGAWWTGSAGETAFVYTNVAPNAPHSAYVKIPSAFQGRTIQDCSSNESDCADASSKLRSGGAEVLLTAAASSVRVLKLGAATAPAPAQTVQPSSSSVPVGGALPAAPGQPHLGL